MWLLLSVCLWVVTASASGVCEEKIPACCPLPLPPSTTPPAWRGWAGAVEEGWASRQRRPCLQAHPEQSLGQGPPLHCRRLPSPGRAWRQASQGAGPGSSGQPMRRGRGRGRMMRAEEEESQKSHWQGHGAQVQRTWPKPGKAGSRGHLSRWLQAGEEARRGLARGGFDPATCFSLSLSVPQPLPSPVSPNQPLRPSQAHQPPTSPLSPPPAPSASTSAFFHLAV